jgi:predicted  nucleic acid-binding Zn-ribbon protein
MTTLGRVFTFLVLLLSVGFFIISLAVNSTHISHKTRLTSLQNQVKQLETTNDELKKFTEQLKTSLSQEQGSRQKALAALQIQLDSAKEQLAQTVKELNDKAAVLTAQTQQISETMDRQKLLNSQNETLKTELDKLITDRNDQRRKVISLTDALNGLKSVEADLLAEKARLQNDATLYQAKAETATAALKAAGISDPEDVPPTELKGEVLAVNSNQLVVVSVGKDDGLREGHKLEVFRNGQYLGRIEIRSLKDDQAIGQILTSFRKGYIQAGDKVAAKIN